ncbi:MAG: OmpA family protein [Deltaproteobacteria bacterium]|nr:OmpA family protein [Deltaproteobacteria bacterium]
MTPTGAMAAADDAVETEVERAPLPTPAVYVGVFGGYHIVFEDWDLNEVSDQGVSPDSSPIFGLRVGVMPSSWFGVEISASLLPYSAEGGRSGLAAAYRGDLHILAGASTFVPYAGVGAGVYQGVSGDLGSDADWEVHWELGLKANVTDWGALRLEGRHSLTDSSSDGLASLLEVTLGFDFFVFRAGAEAPPDTDGDGVSDYDDRCPRQAGGKAARGCPDADGDGVDDERDACVDKPGPKTLGGCPDSDNDGLADDIDKCPDQAGKSEQQGCPVEALDSDFDGIPDDEDVCPDEPGVPEAAGCPDSDGDGILDRDDRCPMQAGTAGQQGCLPASLMAFVGVVKDVQFAAGKSELTAASKARLDALAAGLAEQSTLRVEVSVHSDAGGDAESSRTATQERADAVKAYLVGKGLAAKRITAIGYGGDRPPAAGPAQRVEMLILAN